MRDLLLQKNHDYGTGNIVEFDTLGILVRVRDKTQRLKNLMGFGHGGIRGQALTPKVNDESTLDTWRDVGNYSVLALMLERGWIDLPNEDNFGALPEDLEGDDAVLQPGESSRGPVTVIRTSQPISSIDPTMVSPIQAPWSNGDQRFGQPE